MADTSPLTAAKQETDRVLPVEPPYKRWSYPPGCPDRDWCCGNDVCFWDCQGRDEDA